MSEERSELKHRALLPVPSPASHNLCSLERKAFLLLTPFAHLQALQTVLAGALGSAVLPALLYRWVPLLSVLLRPAPAACIAGSLLTSQECPWTAGACVLELREWKYLGVYSPSPCSQPRSGQHGDPGPSHIRTCWGQCSIQAKSASPWLLPFPSQLSFLPNLSREHFPCPSVVPKSLICYRCTQAKLNNRSNTDTTACLRHGTVENWGSAEI